jgi:hypothetical protein
VALAEDVSVDARVGVWDHVVVVVVARDQ